MDSIRTCYQEANKLNSHTEDIRHPRRSGSCHPTPGGRRGRAESSMLPVQKDGGRGEGGECGEEMRRESEGGEGVREDNRYHYIVI